MDSKPTLYTYCVAHDGGTAPNPYGNTCTLAICKPRIRLSAKEGDWIVGTTSQKAGSNFNMVYAMRVTQKMTLRDYDEYCQNHLQSKLPKPNSKKYSDRQGDCIYDFHHSPDHPLIRKNDNHDERHRGRDLSGHNVLLSDTYYYFGDKAPSIPEGLHNIIKIGPGHKSGSNDPFLNDFLTWISDLDKKYGVGIHGSPLLQTQKEKEFKFKNANCAGGGES